MYNINSKIKVVIWDMDDTFWEGTLSEGTINPITNNIQIVKELTNRGIINTICSKNDFDEVKMKLEEIGIWDYFVFPQVSWDPKGMVIKNLLEILSLRDENTLFIDDNVLNLNESIFFSPKINTCLPEHLDKILLDPNLTGKDDKIHSRLKQYKNLEKKQIEFSKSQLSNIEFLEESDIKVKIEYDCLSQIERIFELVERTNQLNFTKKRPSKNELIEEINDKEATTGYVQVTDKYGDYGISGFFLIKNNKLEHFLFSCRTMNMFIESWLFRTLGSPELKINGEVATKLDLIEKLDFINNTNKKVESGAKQDKLSGNQQILMLGGCDLDQVVYYLNYKYLFAEFNYVNEYNLNVHKDNTFLVRQFKQLSEAQLSLIRKIPILDSKDVESKVFNSNWDILVFSLLNDYSRGLYKHKETGFILPFDAFNIDWSNEANWGNLPKHLLTVPKDFLNLLKNEFEFIGPISPDLFKDNIQWLLDSFKDKKFIFLNGSEIVYEKGHIWEKNMHLRHKELNDVLDTFKSNANVKIVDVRKFVKDEGDITDNIRHYSKIIYKRISDEIQNIANEWLGTKIKTKSGFRILAEKYIKKVANKLSVK